MGRGRPGAPRGAAAVSDLRPGPGGCLYGDPDPGAGPRLGLGVGGKLGREQRSAAPAGAALPSHPALGVPSVQGTGGSSAVSKCSAAARGYIQDRFLRLLVGRRRRRAPLVHRGYYIRARAVDHCVQDFLLKTQSHPRTQVHFP
ncbi:uncharacterized protein LOC133219201 [Neopsephotus bourkii]|uniref:uncharacterized protein LOC133219201 n=1 Tax=Neopsephotus bourkii TaxID=309878 RepID=UPI002AA5DBC0|nr:uncharacterized protein LOC133219201 [Neopsephotus bourkii]